MLRFPDESGEYRHIETSPLYKYNDFIDKYHFKNERMKLFVIFMLCFKKQEALKKYKKFLNDKKLPDDRNEDSLKEQSR